MLVEQLFDHQHEARGTETALERAFLNECLLDRIEQVVAVKVLNGLHHGAVGERREVEAARDGAAVDDQGAAAAQSLAAALARAIEMEIVAHDFEQAVMCADLRGDLFAVEREGDGSPGRHRAYLSPRPSPSRRWPGEGGEALPRLMSLDTLRITLPRSGDFPSRAARATRLPG